MTQAKNIAALQDAGVAIVAGAASALLFMLSARGTYAAMALSYFTPLPLMISTIGFGLFVGGGATLAAGLVIAIMGSPVLAASVGVGLLLPAWLVCVAATRATDTGEDRRVSWVLVIAIAFAFIAGAALVATMVMSHGGFDKARAMVIASVLPELKTVLADQRLPNTITTEELAKAFVAVIPAIVAGSALIMFLVNVYLAGRVALLSGKLSRPWPAIADTIGPPKVFAALFAGACGLIFLSGLPGMIASIAASALGMGFAVQGLAVMHVVTRGSGVRGAILFAIYTLILCVPPWPFFLLALVGLVDAAFHIRRRYGVAVPKKS
jgi:hypothetical protein